MHNYSSESKWSVWKPSEETEKEEQEEEEEDQQAILFEQNIQTQILLPF